MPFHVHEIFPTLQGEGSRTGCPAIFIRLAGCNLWDGIEEHRGSGTGDCARWCDTDFRRGDRMTVEDLVTTVADWALVEGMTRPLVVITGGEPLLQLRAHLGDAERLLVALRRAGMDTALETNGTRPMPRELAPCWSHVTVSPKGLRAAPGSVDHLHPLDAQDLKIVVPCPMAVEDLVKLYRGATLYFQPRDERVSTLDPGANLALARKLAAQHGGRVSIQTHKLLGLP